LSRSFEGCYNKKKFTIEDCCYQEALKVATIKCFHDWRLLMSISFEGCCSQVAFTVEGCCQKAFEGCCQEAFTVEGCYCKKLCCV